MSPVTVSYWKTTDVYHLLTINCVSYSLIWKTIALFNQFLLGGGGGKNEDIPWGHSTPKEHIHHRNTFFCDHWAKIHASRRKPWTQHSMTCSTDWLTVFSTLVMMMMMIYHGDIRPQKNSHHWNTFLSIKQKSTLLGLSGGRVEGTKNEKKTRKCTISPLYPPHPQFVAAVVFCMWVGLWT